MIRVDPEVKVALWLIAASVGLLVLSVILSGRQR